MWPYSALLRDESKVIPEAWVSRALQKVDVDSLVCLPAHEDESPHTANHHEEANR